MNRIDDERAGWRLVHSTVGSAMTLFSASAGTKSSFKLNAKFWKNGLMLLGLAAPVVVTGAASAQQSFRTAGQDLEWADSFDIATDNITEVKSYAPTLSPTTVDYIGAAITRYQSIVQMGGWGTVATGGKALRIGMKDPRVVQLRQRLIISGDLEQQSGLSDTFDSYVDAALRRFQLRHGLIPDGVMGESTVEALNIPAYVRLRQLETNLVRVRSMSGNLGDRYVMVNIPAAEIEAVERWPCPFAPYRRRRQDRPTNTDPEQQDLRTELQPILDRACFHHPQGSDPEDEGRPGVSVEATRSASSTGATTRKWRGNRLTGIRTKRHSTASPRIRDKKTHLGPCGSTSTTNTRSISTIRRPRRLFGEDYRFHSSGCVRVQNVQGIGDLVAAIHDTGLGPHQGRFSHSDGRTGRCEAEALDPALHDLRDRLGELRRRGSFPRRYLQS